MKKLVQATVILAALVVGSTLFAHEGHEHAQPMDQAKAVETASTKMIELIDQGQLASSWATQAPAGAQLARVNGRQNWIVSYLDDSARERLELIFTMTGEFVSMAKTPVADIAAN